MFFERKTKPSKSGPRRQLPLSLMLICSFCAGMAVFQVQEDERKPVTRAERPDFQERDWEGIFFENVFDGVLQGQRPERLEQASETPIVEQDRDQPSQGWEQLIDGSTLEDEVKRLAIELASQLGNQAAFQSERQSVRRNLTMVSMLFAVIGRYEQSVRWKRDAFAVQSAAAFAAIQARTDDAKAFAGTSQFLRSLEDLIRGGSFPDSTESDPQEDWSQIIDRNSVMWRLEYALRDRLKEPLADEGSFQRDGEQVFQEAELIAVLGKVLAEEGMLDADDEDYAQYAKQMTAAGLELKAAVQLGDYGSANQSLTLVNQSCMDCHADWR